MPSGPSNWYALSTASHGIRRRSAASASRARVSSFSFTSRSWRAASHACGDTIGGGFMADSSHNLGPRPSPASSYQSRPLGGGASVGPLMRLLQHPMPVEQLGGDGRAQPRTYAPVAGSTDTSDRRLSQPP